MYQFILHVLLSATLYNFINETDVPFVQAVESRHRCESLK